MNTRAGMTTTRTAPWLAPRAWLTLWVLAAAAAGLMAVRPAHSQQEQAVQIASADELDELVGPIALYPDDLVAIVLPASTYPLQIVQAARLLEDRKRDSGLEPEEDWDDSVVALLNYPEVVEMMNDDLDWTYDLGTAVLNQRADVLNAVQEFRDRAYAAGNLRTDDRQTVARDDGEITIKPADPQVIYVPYYEPERVVIYQTVPVYHYFPRRYPVYYYPYPAGYVFDTGFFWGVRSWYSIGWHSHHVHVYDWAYRNHPYYGWNYYDPWYTRNVYVNINVNRNRDYVWEPRNRYGGRPVVRGNEGRVYNGNTPPARTGGGMAGGAYRSRSVEGTSQARSAAEAARQPRRGVLANGSTAARTEANTSRSQATGAVPRAEASVNRGNAAQQNANTAVRERIYRSGGGMSQAQRQSQTQTNRAVPESRASQGSTGMPREAARAAEPQRSYERAAQSSQEPRGGGMGQAQRGGDGGGTYRGGDGGSRESGNGGGRQHPAARSSEGRGAAR
jgi:hypothetical protein